MFYLILTVCTTAAMDDCEVYTVNQHPTEQRCEVLADVYRQTLGDGHYRLECKQDV